MTRPTARVLALLEILQTGGTRTVGELARRLEVDERTVRRYVEHLLELEVPVQSVRGRYGGYRLAAGYRMPPLMLTSDEALAVLLGLLHSQRSGAVAAGPSTAAAAKLQRVLPRQLAERLAALVQTTRFTADPKEVTGPDAGTLLAVAEAARDHRELALRYVDAAGSPSSRVVHPLGLVAHGTRWYLSAKDATSGALRTFRVDRIASAEPLPDRFEPPPGIDPVSSVLGGLATAPQTHTVVVRVQGSVDELTTRLPPALATLDPVGPPAASSDDEQSWVRVTIHADHLDWLPGLLVGLGRPFRVEQPAQLRALVLEVAARLTAGAG